MINFQFDYKPYQKQVLEILREIYEKPLMEGEIMRKFLQEKAKKYKKTFSKNDLLFSLKKICEQGETEEINLESLKWLSKTELVKKLQIKPTRTISGVTPVTVLTKPFPCPGQCIFCPNDLRMPKSYLSDEPGAQRAERNGFDPYLQTFGRLKALQNIGHEVNKVELIVLGGTWSFYSESYQIWFIKRCFEALNDFGQKKEIEYTELLTKIGDKNYRSNPKNIEIIRNVPSAEPFEGKASQTYNQIISKRLKEEKQTPYILSQKATWEELFKEQEKNEESNCKSVGLVIETRPDKISPKEVIRIRKLGCTKTQIGFQSLNDDVLKLNHRGHNVEATKYAVKLLRLAGFKIHAHWMANLYGSTPQKDQEDFAKMFDEIDFLPDELKVYPCSLLQTAELMDYYKEGLWKPYSQEELLEVMVSVMTKTPEYCRLTRIIRDIPSTDIVVGNKKTNFREIAQKELNQKKLICEDIRAREIRKKQVSLEELELKAIWYNSNIGSEIFLQFVTKQNEIAGFLRLFLPFLEIEKDQIYEIRLLKQLEFIQKETIQNTQNDFKIERKIDILADLINSKTIVKFLPNQDFLDQIQTREIKFKHPFLEELDNCAIIREVHIYGQSVKVGDKSDLGKAQHLGLGSKLIENAQGLVKKIGYSKIAVISSVGTRKYYQKFDFKKNRLYQTKELKN
jgi:elongator complex protein 3